MPTGGNSSSIRTLISQFWSVIVVQLFYMTPDGHLCANCGIYQQY